MIKHVAKHEQKKAVVLFKKVPNEDHMCLVVYPETLPKLYHDSVMKCVESAVGQNADELGEPLGRELMDDGRMTLQALHQEGFIRKVQTNQVIMTPAAGSTVRLDELNNILAEMASGKDAAQRLAELDSQAGLYHPDNALPGDIIEEVAIVQEEDVLSDASLARDQIEQAERMTVEASALVAEAKYLKDEAYKLDPSLKPKRTYNKKTPAEKKALAKKAGTKKAGTKKQSA